MPNEKLTINLIFRYSSCCHLLVAHTTQSPLKVIVVHSVSCSHTHTFSLLRFWKVHRFPPHFHFCFYSLFAIRIPLHFFFLSIIIVVGHIFDMHTTTLYRLLFILHWNVTVSVIPFTDDFISWCETFYPLFFRFSAILLPRIFVIVFECSCISL